MTPARIVLTSLAFATLLTAGATRMRGTDVGYPAGYREWTHVKSELLGPEHPAFPRFGGLHHIYANDPAMRGYRSGRFPDGSVVVFDLLAVNHEEGRTFATSRRHLDVMEKDSARFPSTGGWGFAEFPGDSTGDRLSPEAKRSCAACHQRMADDLVISEYRDR
jgi:hypothetical protein